MKHHIAFKFLAVLICALTLLASLLCVAAVVLMERSDLYEQDLEAVLKEYEQDVLRTVASDIAARYASEHLGGCDPSAIRGYYGVNYRLAGYFKSEYISWDILDENGDLIYRSQRTGDNWTATEVAVTGRSYLQQEGEGLMGDPVPNTYPTTDTTDKYGFIDMENGAYTHYTLTQMPMPAWTVVLYLKPNAWLDAQLYHIVLLVWQLRYDLFWILGISLLIFAISAVYLCCAAGRRPGSEEIAPGGFNMMPLDLYALLGCFFIGCCLLICVEIYRWFNTSILTTLLCYLFVAFACCLVFVAFCFGCAAQFKMPRFYWLRHTLVGYGCIFLWRVVKGLWKILSMTPGALWNALNNFKTLALTLFRWVCRVIRNIFRWIFRKIHRVYRLLPLTWQWLLTGVTMVVLLLLGITSAQDYHSSGFGLLICVGLCLMIVLYGAHAFGILMEGVKRMRQGDLDAKVADRLLIGAFLDLAEDLNALADVTKEAARKEMRSERMKTELITNVSHDIKTPLTSIINYVDLLQKPHTPQEEAQYLEVLGRKSQQLKKLIQDLMEMSKASTGNMAVNLSHVDAAETLTQALGEFADKLQERQLNPIFQPPKEPILMVADGRLAWRVLQNLLSNAVKYALPGTRLYVDLTRQEGWVRISLKNVSAEPLNLQAEDLTERFVRGDAARNSEGSGLGLNIAKSLMEVQNGALSVTVDGDLFKVTLSFPTV